jgi:DNA repair photolyase
VKGSYYGASSSREVKEKTNALELLEKQLSLRAKKGEYGFIVLSSATEAYMPAEKKIGLTRSLLEVILKYRFPVHMITRSMLVLRDLDVLKCINKDAVLPEDLKSRVSGGVIASFSIPSVNEQLSKVMEPGAALPRERMETMKQFKQEGILSGVVAMPIFPFLSDSDNDIEALIREAKRHGADYVLFSTLTLSGIGQEHTYRVLKVHFPDILEGYERLYSGGRKTWQRFEGNLQLRARSLLKKYGLKPNIQKV